MIRMGPDSMRAALIYQHGTRIADQHITDALTRHIEAETRPEAAAADAGFPAIEQHVTA